MLIRAATARDHAAILALNAESVKFLSPMDAPRLLHLDRQAAYHRVVQIDDEVAAFLLVLREGADYDSPNYRWFAATYARFLYIDRVVVSTAHQGRRLGAVLYDDLFAFARADGIDKLTCEFDIDPPNEGSRIFHARHGFREVGQQRLGGGKLVSLQLADVTPLSS